MGQYDFVLDDGPSSRTKKSSSKDSPMLSQLTEMLEGFRMGTSRSQLKKTFPPPVLPRNWKPSTTGFVRKSRFEKVTEQEPVRSTTNPTREILIKYLWFIPGNFCQFCKRAGYRRKYSGLKKFCFKHKSKTKNTSILIILFSSSLALLLPIFVWFLYLAKEVGIDFQ